MKILKKTSLIGLFLGAGGLLLGGSQEAEAQGSKDFRFGEPHFSLAFNVGYGMPRAGSDIYDFVMSDLTLQKSDFYSMVFGGSLGYRLTNRVELSLDVSYGNSNTRSEFRDWVDQDDLPIEQNTRLSWTPVTVSLKGYLWERGRRISQLAWVPGKWSPFLGVGGGEVYYKFRQSGDFIDFETLEIFTDTFRSSGGAGVFHVLAGAEWSLGPYFYLTGEGRYSWASARMGRDFVGFDPIDLSGFQGTVGLALRF
ncbi:MAG: hypothetical protein ACWGSQ_04610 [Longimicrobiales bacterium]